MRKLVVGVVLTATLLATIGIAGAENPPASYHPDESGTDVSSGSILSDRDDGLDQRAHLAVVAEAPTDRVDWYFCPVVVNEPVSQQQLEMCTLIGQDDSPVVPDAPITSSPIDEAYEFFWDIPAELDHQIREIVALACTGTGSDVEGPDANCKQSVEIELSLDDVPEDGGGQTTAGAIVSYCTSDVDASGPTSSGSPANDPCNFEESYSDDQKAQIAARFSSFFHGALVPNNGFVIRALTSEDLPSSGELRAARFYGIGAGSDPGLPEQDVACFVVGNVGGFGLWECSFPDDSVLTKDDNQEQAVWIYETSAVGSGEGFCAGAACTLDAAYVASRDFAGVTIASATFETSGSSCAFPDDSETNEVATSEDVTVCLRKGDGTPIVGLVTLESSGAGGFTDCGELSTPHDHDNNSLVEHCHGSTALDGAANDITIGSAFTQGEQSITSCLDDENGASSPSPGNPPPPNHGCGDEKVKAQISMRWARLPHHVHLVIAASGDPANPCHSGDLNAQLRVSEKLTMVACTRDSLDAPSPTSLDGAGGLFWRIDPSGGAEPFTATRFDGEPPMDTDGPEATVATGLEAVRPGNDVVTVRLCAESGVCTVGEATIQVLVTAGDTQCTDGIDNDRDDKTDYVEDPGCDGPDDDREASASSRVKTHSTIGYEEIARRFTGRISSKERRCKSARKVSLLHETSGKDRVVGRDVSVKSGSWKISERAPDGRYRATVARKVLGDGTVCLAGRSSALKVTRDRPSRVI